MCSKGTYDFFTCYAFYTYYKWSTLHVHTCARPFHLSYHCTLSFEIQCYELNSILHRSLVGNIYARVHVQLYAHLSKSIRSRYFILLFMQPVY